MFSNTKLRSAASFVLGLSAGTLALGASPSALAQDDAAEGIEEITMTGSRIKRADLDSASPVTVIDREARRRITAVTDLYRSTFAAWAWIAR